MRAAWKVYDANKPAVRSWIPNCPRGFQRRGYVYHLAAIITLTRDRDGRVWRTNVEGTRNVVDACVARVRGWST